MIILAFDPGETTGYAVLETPLTLVDWGQLRGIESVAALIESTEPDEVVAESFVLYPGIAHRLSHSKLEPVQVIGAIQVICIQQEIPYVEQPPSCKKAISTNLLRALEMFKRKNDHANDAIRHALYRAWFGLGLVNKYPEIQNYLSIER